MYPKYMPTSRRWGGPEYMPASLPVRPIQQVRSRRPEKPHDHPRPGLRFRHLVKRFSRLPPHAAGGRNGLKQCLLLSIREVGPFRRNTGA